MRWLIVVLALAFPVLEVRAHADLEVQIDAVTARLAASPRDAALYLKRAELRREHRDWAGASADYDRAAALAPKFAAIELCRGRMLLESGRDAEAVPVLRRYLAGSPEDAHGWAFLAQAQARGDQSKASALAWDRALAASADEEPALPDWRRWRDDARRRAGLEPAAAPSSRPHSVLDDDWPEGLQSTARLLRGPYLQMATPDSIIIRWRTDVPTDSAVLYGRVPAKARRRVLDRTLTADHVVRLTGLKPASRYRYTIGSSAQVLAGDVSTTFLTPPTAGTEAPTRVWVLGDSGTADANAARVRDAFAAYTGSRDPDVWLMLGDNAYESGLDAEYQAAVFDMYAATLRRIAVWSTLGNHDGYSADSGTQSGPYYDIFSLPRAGEAGGVPSTTEAYYSFNHANIHFVCLDSYGSSRLAGSPMLEWLERDLAANRQPWTIAFWHHPPYSKGSHDSDYESELYEMRENALPILEAHGVDLVLAGHSHSYERSYLIDGHYGISTTFGPANLKDGGDGRPDGNGVYTKSAAPNTGAVYAVAGSSGQISGGTLDHPAMWISLDHLGSMVLDVDGGRLDAVFLNDTGVVDDHFTIRK